MQTVEIEILPKQAEYLQATERHVLYSGAVGAGKTRALCLKLAMRAATPGAREGLCRKHLVTLKATTLKTLLEGDGPMPAILPLGYYEHNKSEKTIKLKGGGEIVYFGFDDPAKAGSYNLSGLGIDEAVELTDLDYAQGDFRVRLDVPGLPRQIYGACNPGPPSHHLAKRFALGGGNNIPAVGSRAIRTRSTDNFFLPPDYLAQLATYSGLAKARFVDGQWVGSDGLVYDRWDRTRFVVDRSGEQWRRIVVGQDEGYTNPAAMLVVGEDNDGRLHVIEEWYEAKKLEAEVIAEAQRIHGRYRPEAFIVDPAAAKLRAAMRNVGLPVREANNDVFPGIQRVQQRLIVAGDGRPRLTVSPTCANLIRELETYEWKVDRSNKSTKDEPKKENDHACFVAGTMIVTSAGEVPIEHVHVGDLVLTRRGYRRVTVAGMTDASAPLVAIELSNGRRLVGTPNHPIFTGDSCTVRMDALRYGDTMIACPEHVHDQSPSSSMASRFDATPTRSDGRIECTSSRLRTTGSGALVGSTKRFGRLCTGRSRLVITSTTATAIRSTTRSTIWSACRRSTTFGSTARRSRMTSGNAVGSLPMLPGPSLRNGIDLKPVANGIAFTVCGHGKAASLNGTSASDAGRDMNRSPRMARIGSARTPVEPPPVVQVGPMTWTRSASVAGAHSAATDSSHGDSVPVRVLAVHALPDRAAVYNLTVEGDHEYFAAGVLVHNCDALRYTIAFIDGMGQPPAMSAAKLQRLAAYDD